LLQKLTHDDELAAKIKAIEKMDAKLLLSIVSTYNAAKK
jgi:2,3-bisphosphoglycerate-independent phosphoglycerate mutase